jgi:hypothetical protein
MIYLCQLSIINLWVIHGLMGNYVFASCVRHGHIIFLRLNPTLVWICYRFRFFSRIFSEVVDAALTSKSGLAVKSKTSSTTHRPRRHTFPHRAQLTKKEHAHMEGNKNMTKIIIDRTGGRRGRACLDHLVYLVRSFDLIKGVARTSNTPLRERMANTSLILAHRTCEHS